MRLLLPLLPLQLHNHIVRVGLAQEFVGGIGGNPVTFGRSLDGRHNGADRGSAVSLHDDALAAGGCGRQIAQEKGLCTTHRREFHGYVTGGLAHQTCSASQSAITLVLTLRSSAVCARSTAANNPSARALSYDGASASSSSRRSRLERRSGLAPLASTLRSRAMEASACSRRPRWSRSAEGVPPPLMRPLARSTRTRASALTRLDRN